MTCSTALADRPRDWPTETTTCPAACGEGRADSAAKVDTTASKTHVAAVGSRAVAASLPLIDIGKVLASQLIVWHHLALYSPMRQVMQPLAPALFDWLADSARLAVQVFLVMAGFLAARSLMPDPASVQSHTLAKLPQRLWQRYLRLAPPCLVAIALALCSAALARHLSDDPAIPELPSWRQLLANLLFLQDIVGEDALNAGLWYVAIDLQLYAAMLLLVGVRLVLARSGCALAPATWLLVGGACAGSLLWLNRQPEHDVWAGYFFGAYGLGVLAGWYGRTPADHSRRRLLPLLVAGLVIAALALEWRSRVALAGSVALALMLWPQGPLMQRWARRPAWAWLARTSYSVFLVHYAVCLLVGAVVQAWWPDSIGLNGLALVAAWAFSLAAGGLLHHHVECRGQRAVVRKPGRPVLALVAARF